MIRTFRALSALLTYPDAELQAAIPDIRQVLEDEQLVARETLEPMLTRLETGKLLDLQVDYVDLFDRTPRLSLYLFEHIHGDSRERGQAMVNLHALYQRHGLEIGGRELPDYLPLFLEFLATRPLDEARALLGETVHILAALRQRLEERDSGYALVLQALCGLADRPPAPQALTKLRDLPDADPETLDRAWAEAPVTFGPACTATEQPIIFDRRKPSTAPS
ncbi:nitrate reductase molybdenum cofactor assembly chaperone NarJ/NarW [Methylomarinovum tepidoasis]|uniref:Nitrate reductase molybdenum cofactor assembly chaperone NarJ/NarW n=1 Tax=Methylomarinovum tepidoasis TaxID=2840183 RepID=A0AAU9C2T1_9GAMM|nr:nitrate reductase molybdenum cofactor assembly chaperone [Methylomarinovum sp. IN45]BCX87672.1 nitrate reductase molybdenum cofactor assembly chaperone NarJ/NarW [Methylomarinovum sp. IN45]